MYIIEMFTVLTLEKKMECKMRLDLEINKSWK